MYEFKPSYKVYRQIIKDIKRTNKSCSYEEAIGKDEFVIMRHDVEFSLDRACELSKVESDEGFNSTYFIQITNNSYNAFSGRNIKLIKDMAERGHHIGLHYHINGQRDQIIVRDGVRDQIRIMSEMIGIPINSFSFHRPVKEIYYYDIAIPNVINAYSPQFFTYADTITDETKLDVKYIADSKHRWNYGFPDYDTIMFHPKVQLLIHPFSWTESGYDNCENFVHLMEEKRVELIDTLTDEFQRFREVREQILDK